MRKTSLLIKGACTLLTLAIAAVTPGCGSAKPKSADKGFFTSGSREADQRASQRMAKSEQVAGSGEGAGERETRKTEKGPAGLQTANAQSKQSLFERLGGEQGVTAIVDDFTARALQDPRVNWPRKGVTRAKLFHRSQTEAWTPTPQHVAALKQHLAQFIALATGGPAHYEGKDMKGAHAAMHITNPEFDAAVGDLKAALDKLQIPNKEQKELLAIIESTRPEIVTER
jgi:hemoglobin